MQHEVKRLSFGKYRVYSDSIEDYHSKANITFNALIYKWENYKIKYDQLHGFGEYDRLYKIPSSFNEISKNDDCSEQEENDSYQDNYDYDYDYDYYDECENDN